MPCNLPLILPGVFLFRMHQAGFQSRYERFNRFSINSALSSGFLTALLQL
jgi:hypothetical protein